MSVRTQLHVIDTIEPIRDAVASGRAELVDVVVKAYRGDGDEIREFAESMLLTDTPPEIEPGTWCYALLPLAGHLQLSPQQLEFDDWKHFWVWDDYIAMASPHVDDSTVKFLGMMLEGRPLRGKELGEDACLFAWLTPTEVVSLHDRLSLVNQDVFGELGALHEELVASLKVTRERKGALLMLAH